MYCERRPKYTDFPIGNKPSLFGSRFVAAKVGWSVLFYSLSLSNTAAWRVRFPPLQARFRRFHATGCFDSTLFIVSCKYNLRRLWSWRLNICCSQRVQISIGSESRQVFVFGNRLEYEPTLLQERSCNCNYFFDYRYFLSLCNLYE